MRAAGAKQKRDVARAGSSLDGSGSKEHALHENLIRITGKFETPQMSPAPQTMAAVSPTKRAESPSPRNSDMAAAEGARFLKDTARKLPPPKRKLSKHRSNSFNQRPTIVDVGWPSVQSRGNREFKALCMGDLIALKIGSGEGFNGSVQVSATQSCFVEKVEDNDVDLKYDTMVFRICPRLNYRHQENYVPVDEVNHEAQANRLLNEKAQLKEKSTLGSATDALEAKYKKAAVDEARQNDEVRPGD